jgi:hypothetical protein
MILNRYGCALVPLLLKRNNGVLFGVLRVPRSDAPFFLACYGSAIILWVLYIYILSLYLCTPKIYWGLSYAWCLVVSFLLCFEALFCHVVYILHPLAHARPVLMLKKANRTNISIYGNAIPTTISLLIRLPINIIAWSSHCN